MKKAGAPFLLGLVLLVGLALLAWMFRTVESDSRTSGETRLVVTRFDDASGLVARSRVLVSGVPVGTIQSISLDPDDMRKARVEMRVGRGIELREGVFDPATGAYANGTVVRRVQGSLLGDYYLEIVPGLAGPPIAEGGEVRNVVSKAGLDAVMEQFGQGSRILPALEKILVDLSAVTGNLKDTLGGDQGGARMNGLAADVARSAADIAAITADLRKVVGGSVLEHAGGFGRIVDNIEQVSANAVSLSAESGALLRETLKDLRAITRDVRDIVGSSGPDVQASLGTVKGTLEQVEESLEVLQETLDTLHHVTRKIDRGQGTVGRLVNDDRLVNDIETSVEAASDFVTKIVRLQTYVGVRSDYLIRSEGFRTAFSLRLQPREDKYYLFELVDAPGRRSSVLFRTTQADDPGRPPVVNEVITSSEDKLRFSVQFAKRLWFTTWRLGLIESTGGVGLDVEAWRNHLMLSTELFDLGTSNQPRLRAFLQFQFLRYFFVGGGVDDALNPVRDGFVSLGLRFQDEDLKTLFTTTPSVSF